MIRVSIYLCTKFHQNQLSRFVIKERETYNVSLLSICKDFHPENWTSTVDH